MISQYCQQKSRDSKGPEEKKLASTLLSAFLLSVPRLGLFSSACSMVLRKALWHLVRWPLQNPAKGARTNPLLLTMHCPHFALTHSHSLHSAQCTVHSAQCTVHNAQCKVHCAQSALLDLLPRSGWLAMQCTAGGEGASAYSTWSQPNRGFYIIHQGFTSSQLKVVNIMSNTHIAPVVRYHNPQLYSFNGFGSLFDILTLASSFSEVSSLLRLGFST